jgi:cystathionine beta-lyase family protein involved in aluminum resistance
MISWSENLDEKLVKLINETEEKIAGMRKKVQDIALVNQSKVLDAFRKHHLSDAHFANSTGYGYDDPGRDALENIYASTFKTEAALVRPHIISGTHAIATALFGVLRPGDDLLYITGEPYDTLLEVVSVAGNGIGSFKEYNIGYDFVLLNKDNTVDFNAVKEKITKKTKVIAIQRSRGYSSRPSFKVNEIQKMCEFVKSINSEIIIFVDNCYGEFVEEKEPTEVGADLMAGSLIKNPGGGLAKTGGYIVGYKDLVEKCGYRLTIPGVGGEGGAMIGSISDMLQGFFLAPHVVSQAIQGAIFTAAILEGCSVSVCPKWDEVRTDLIQIAELKNKKAMVTFCQAIQKFSPIDSFVTPLPESMPGYEDKIIMAAGAFVQGATIELSADGPIRKPYNLYIQGGLTYEHIKIAIVEAINDVYFS